MAENLDTDWCRDILRGSANGCGRSPADAHHEFGGHVLAATYPWLGYRSLHAKAHTTAARANVAVMVRRFRPSRESKRTIALRPLDSGPCRVGRLFADRPLRLGQEVTGTADCKVLMSRDEKRHAGDVSEGLVRTLTDEPCPHQTSWLEKPRPVSPFTGFDSLNKQTQQRVQVFHCTPADHNVSGRGVHWSMPPRGVMSPNPPRAGMQQG